MISACLYFVSLIVLVLCLVAFVVILAIASVITGMGLGWLVIRMLQNVPITRQSSMAMPRLNKEVVGEKRNGHITACRTNRGRIGKTASRHNSRWHRIFNRNRDTADYSSE